MTQDKPIYRVIALDGDGVSALSYLPVLQDLENFLGGTLARSGQFRLFIGASTGSIIATLLKMGMPLSKIRLLYTRLCQRVFSKTSFSDRLFSPYKTNYLQRALHEIFGEITWGDLQTIHPSIDLFLSLWDVTQKKNIALHSKPDTEGNNHHFTRARIADILTASCSSPFYFAPQVFAFQDKKSLYVDSKISGKDVMQLTSAYLASLSENLQIFSFGHESITTDLSYDTLRKWSATEMPLHLLQTTFNEQIHRQNDDLNLYPRIPSLNQYFQITPIRHLSKNEDSWRTRLQDFEQGHLYGKIWNRDGSLSFSSPMTLQNQEIQTPAPLTNTSLRMPIQPDGDPNLIVPALFQAIQEQNLEQALQIAEVLSHVDPLEEELLDSLLKQLENAPPFMRKSLNHIFQKLTLAEKYAIAEALQRILLKGNPRARREAACLFASLGSEKTVLNLIQKLEDRDPVVRKHLCWALGSLGKEAIRAIPALKEALQDTDGEVQKKASWALTQIAPYAPEEIIPFLLELLQKSAGALQQEVVWMLSETGLGTTPEHALPSFLNLLKKITADSSLKLWVERALQKSSASANRLIAELQKTTTHSDKIFRKNAFWMLTLIPPISAESLTLFLPLLTDEDPELKQLALSVLGSTQHVEALPQLLKILQESEDMTLRIHTIKAIGNMESKAISATKTLISLVKEGDLEERRVAAWALGKLRADEAVPVLKQMLQEEEYFILSSAVFTLGGLNPDSERTAPTLLDALLREDYRSLRIAITALGEIGAASASAIPELAALLQNRNEYVREETANTLGLIGKKANSAIQELLIALDDISERVRLKVVWALGEIGDRQVIPALLNSQKDSSVRVQEQAKQSLERLGQLSAPSLTTIWQKSGLTRGESAEEFIFPSPVRSSLPILSSWALRPVWYKQYEWVLLLLLFASLFVLTYGVPLLYQIQ